MHELSNLKFVHANVHKIVNKGEWGEREKEEKEREREREGEERERRNRKTKRRTERERAHNVDCQL